MHPNKRPNWDGGNGPVNRGGKLKTAKKRRTEKTGTQKGETDFSLDLSITDWKGDFQVLQEGINYKKIAKGQGGGFREKRKLEV